MLKKLYLLLLLFFTPFLTTQALAGACTDITADDATTTISADCTDLDISGDDTTTTINSGVTVSTTGGNEALTYPSTSTGGYITNNGTIQSLNNDGLTLRGGLIELNNTGTITADGTRGLYATGDSSITTLTNSGTITAGSGDGVYNDGTITTFTNTGTISQINNVDTITTFNNDQGKVDSDYVEWKINLPTNYNIIINSTSDYGITNFTSPSGTLNFGIDSSSTINDSYYSNVLTGLSSSYINNDSGSTTINGTIYTWNLKNPSGTTWDLYVVSDTSTNLSLTTEVAPTLRTAFNFADTMSFAHINTYDCDTFGAHNWCFSVGGRGTMIANANTSKHSSAFLLGKKFSEQFRVALFYDNNHDYYDSKNMTVDKQQPMVGGSLVWNQKDNHSGYAMKLSHAFQQQNLALTRPKVGVSFKGTGETQMTAHDTAAEVKYNYQQNTLTISPYGVLRYSNKTIDSFTETTADYPLTYNEISAKTLALIAGIKFIKPLTTSINLNGALAVNHNIHHTIDNLIPSGLNGLQRIDLEDDYNATLPIASLGLEYSISGGHSIATTVQHQALSYQSMSETNIYVQYAFAL
jgi:hypothetical protein